MNLSVIPEGEPQSALMSNGFVMLDDRMVVTETLTAELTLTSSRDISAYRAAFEKLDAVAVSGAGMRQLLVGVG